jgi:hypothetical protein
MPHANDNASKVAVNFYFLLMIGHNTESSYGRCSLPESTTSYQQQQQSGLSSRLSSEHRDERKVGYQYPVSQFSPVPQQPGNLPSNLDHTHTIDHRPPTYTDQQRMTSKDTGRRCASCGVDNTPLWRRGQNGETLCNACGKLKSCRTLSETKAHEITITHGQ